MLLPSIFGEDLFDDMMDFPFEDEFFGRKNPLYGKRAKNLMKTDVKETENGYELDIDLPGFKKDEIKAELKEGYLTISAAKNVNNDEKKDGKYIRQERFTGNVSRSFYVGKNLTQEDIHAKFENGILTLDIPKKDQKQVEENRYVTIEG